MQDQDIPPEKTGLFRRRVPVGAELLPTGGAHFRVWAPASQKVSVLLEDATIELTAERDGYFSGTAADGRAGMAYRYQLDHGTFPDPASRFQPEGPHGPSLLVEPGSFRWTDQQWKGLTRDGQVIYEMHIGTFTQAGTWEAACNELEELAKLGVTVLEVMPVADFAGRYGWGYDGVNLYAPTRLYGEPDDFRTFVDKAHAAGLGVILDVVYNHLGPDGQYLTQFSKDYFSRDHHCEWGDALNFDGENSDPVRELFISNAGYWVDEYHLDGLRLDATQQVFDRSKDHVLAAIVRCAREAGAGKSVYIVAENEPQLAKLVRPPDQGGYGIDALWNDDFHHSAIVSMTGRNEAYYSDYKGSAQEFVSSAKWGFLYQGQMYKWQKNRRGTPSLDLQPSNFITFIQNHDQIANTLWGRRTQAVTSASQVRALTALLLLGPGTPMLFQGQEFAASSPFFYFADHTPELAAAVAKGRSEFLKQFPSIAAPEAQAMLADPRLEETFTRSKLDFADRERHADMYLLHKDLLALRRTDPFFGKALRGNYDGAVLGESTLVLRFFGRNQDDRLLIVNLGKDMQLNPAPEPLLAPPDGCLWQVVWSSEDPRYGGGGTPQVETEENWHLPAYAAVVLIPQTHEHSSKSDPKN
ncbi:MAG: 1,4-alpha-glucan branching protein [Verrucomicrobiaceae bacterium]|nr:1,4-alpha-glucan branching protein [Verrucomicrobiaceae bacterium]